MRTTNPLELNTRPGEQAVSPVVSQATASSMLGLTPEGVSKLVHAGIITTRDRVGRGPGLLRSDIEALRDRPTLTVDAGELTVLRTEPASPVIEPDREWKGWSSWMTDDQINLACLQWWRGGGQRILTNEIFVTTMSTIPVAVHDITDIAAVTGTGTDLRRSYTGNLLARYGGENRATTPRERDLVDTIMRSRIYTVSGGPIAYLSA